MRLPRRAVALPAQIRLIHPVAADAKVEHLALHARRIELLLQHAPPACAVIPLREGIAEKRDAQPVCRTRARRCRTRSDKALGIVIRHHRPLRPAQFAVVDERRFIRRSIRREVLFHPLHGETIRL